LTNYFSDFRFEDEKKTVNFGPQTKKLLTCILTHPSGRYSGDYISAPMGCYTLKFLHALESVQGYLAHTPTGTGVPRNKFNRENLKFGLKFSVCTSITSGIMGISSQIFIHTTCREPGVITWVQFLEDLSPKIWEGKKTVQNFSRFLTTFDFDREYLQNGSTNRQSKKQLINYDPSHVGLKTFLNFGPQTKKLLT